MTSQRYKRRKARQLLLNKLNYLIEAILASTLLLGAGTRWL